MWHGTTFFFQSFIMFLLFKIWTLIYKYIDWNRTKCSKFNTLKLILKNTKEYWDFGDRFQLPSKGFFHQQTNFSTSNSLWITAILFLHRKRTVKNIVKRCRKSSWLWVRNKYKTSKDLSYDISHLEILHVTCDNMLDGMCMLFYRPIWWNIDEISILWIMNIWQVYIVRKSVLYWIGQ